MGKPTVISNAKFHEWLNEFNSFTVGKYKKVPYQDYRNLKKVNSPTVTITPQTMMSTDFKARTYLSLTEEDGRFIYSCDIDDGSFGEFLYGKIIKEALTEVGDEKINDYEKIKVTNAIKEKKEYDLWGDYNIVYDASKHYDGTAVDLIADYASKYATSEACSVSAKDTGSTAVYVGDINCGSGSSAATISTLHTEIKTGLDVVRDDIEDLQAKIGTKAERADMQADVFRLDGEIDYLADCKADRMDVDRLAWDFEEAFRGLEKRVSNMEELHKPTDVEFAYYDEKDGTIRYDRVPIENVKVQSTSSNVYTAKNYKIDFAGMPCSDERKEKENMDTNKMFAGFEFGPVDDRIKMSPYGMAVRNADGRYVSYDAKSGNIVDVEVFNFGNHNLIFKAPVAVSAIAVGDTIIHMKKPMFVTNVENGITAIDIYNGEIKTIMPATNMFGFNFVTKVVSLFNFTGANAPTAENPFGNILPFILMGNESKDFKEMLPLLLFANGNGNLDMSNPIVMYALMGDNGNMSDMLPFLLMGNAFNQPAPAAPAHPCGCQHNGENHQ